MSRPARVVSSADPWRCPLLFHQSLRKCKLNQAGRILYRHLVHNGCTLILYGALAEIQAACNLLHGILFTDEPYDVQLALRELRRVAPDPVYLYGEVTQGAHDQLIVVKVFVDHRIDGFFHFLRRRPFRQVSMRARADQLLNVLSRVLHRAHHHLDSRLVLLNPLTDLLAAHDRHVQVYEGNVGRRVLDHADKLLATRRLAYLTDTAERLDQADEPLAEQHMIVRQVNPDFGRTLH